MAATTLLSDNGVTSGITGYTLTGGNDGTLQLQTTTAGGTATTAMTITEDQNVGVGTSSPADFTPYGYGPTIETRGGFGGSFVSSNSDNTLQTVLSNNQDEDAGYLKTITNHGLAFGTNDTERMRLDTSGNLGLGVTPSAWDSVTKAVEFTGGALFSSATSNIQVGSNFYRSAAAPAVYRYKVTGVGAANYEQFNGAHYWYNANAGTAGNPITFATALSVNTNGALALQGASLSASGVGITFPTTQVPSTNAKTLDDYEEGTWTVATNGSGNLSSITFTVAKYIKIGRLVQVQMSATYSTPGSGNTYVVFSLPFAMDSAGSVAITGTICIYNEGTNFSLNSGCIVDNSSGDSTYAFGGWYVPGAITSKTVIISMTYQAST